MIGCKLAGMGTDRHGHRDADADMSTRTQMQEDWKCKHKNRVKKEMTTHQTHCRGREAGAATTGVARHGAQAGRWMQGRTQG